jgi:hypothetical protein
MIGFTRFLAWAYLILSAIAAIFILVNYSTSEVYSGGAFSYSKEVTNPIGIGTGIGVAVQGLIVFCLLLLVAQIAENTSKPLLATTEAKEAIVDPKKIVPIQKGVNDISTGQLHDAVWDGNYILAKKLIKSGADVQAKRSSDGKTPMDLAVDRGDKLLMDLLK